MPENPEPTNEMDAILNWLHSDRDLAAEILMELRKRLVFYFRFYYDPESLADEVIDRVLEKLRDNKIDKSGKAKNYIWGTARNLRSEKFREKKVFSLDESIDVQSMKSVEDDSENLESLYQSVSDCIATLAGDGTIFVRYFMIDEGAKSKESREKIAADEGISLSDLRVKIFRIKQKIIRCLKKKSDKDRFFM